MHIQVIPVCMDAEAQFFEYACRYARVSMGFGLNYKNM